MNKIMRQSAYAEKFIRKAVALALVAGCCLSVRAAVRTVAVSSFDASQGTVTLAFGGASENRVLFLAQDVSDKGESPDSWASVSALAYIPAGQNSFVYEVPQSLRRSGAAFRFFLCKSTLPCECPVDYIRPTAVANNLYYDTGIKADKFTALTLDCQIMEGTLNSEKAILGVGNGGGAGLFTQKDNAYIYIPAADPNTCDWAAVPALCHSSTLGIGDVRHLIAIGYQVGLTVDGEAVPVYGRKTTTPYAGGYECDSRESVATIKLFTIVNDQASYSAQKNCSPDVRIYGFELRKSGTPVMRLKPCIQDGILKFYDEVGNKSLPPSVANSFTYGKIDIEVKDATVDSSAPFLFKKGDFGRSISIACGNDSSTIELQFGGAGEKCLYVAHDLQDKGTDPKDWAEVVALGNIGAETASYTYIIPEDWRGSEHVLRFFLSSRDEDSPYDELYQWIYTGSGSGFFDTKIVPTRDTVVMIDMKFDDDYPNLERGIFGLWPYLGLFSQNTRMFVNLPGIDPTDREYLTTEGAGSVSWNGQRKVLRIGKSEVSFDGEQQKLYKSNTELYDGTFDNELIPQTTRTLPLFKHSVSADGTDVKGSAPRLWLYSCDIVTNNIPARRFFAATKDGAICLYDDVSKTMFSPNSVATFSVGGGTRGPTLTFERSETTVLFRQIRSVTVDSFDQMSDSFVLTFGGVPVENALFAVYDERGDRGSNPLDWDKALSLGMIPASVTKTNLVGVLPRKWLRHGGAIRFLFGYVPFERRLEWVSNDSKDSYGQYILTDYRPKANCELTIKARHRIENYVPFGISREGKYQLFYALPHSGGHLYAGYFGDQVTIDGTAAEFILANRNLDIEDTPVYELRISRSGVWFPDLQTKVHGEFSPNGTFQTDAEGRSLYGLCFFGTLADNLHDKYKTPIRIYSVLVREAGTTVFDLVPCVKDGEAGFYDKAHGAFLGNTGSGSLVAGPDIGFQLEDATLGDVSSACQFSKLGLFIVIK